ncbi:hypothetical protein S40293_11508 [Stachybotrys chartarum IBT 40293]|nr:hypothetical protein S40293_11508 [Stachybotrys chartarum IBT 40293]
MTARTRSKAQKRSRAFQTRRQGLEKKVKEMHHLTDAKAAFLVIHKGELFCHDEAGVLQQLGITIKCPDNIGSSKIITADSCESGKSRTASSATSSFIHTTSTSSSPALEHCSELIHKNGAATDNIDNNIASSAAMRAPFSPDALSVEGSMTIPCSGFGERNLSAIETLDFDFLG